MESGIGQTPPFLKTEIKWKKIIKLKQDHNLVRQALSPAALCLAFGTCAIRYVLQKSRASQLYNLTSFNLYDRLLGLHLLISCTFLQQLFHIPASPTSCGIYITFDFIPSAFHSPSQEHISWPFKFAFEIWQRSLWLHNLCILHGWKISMIRIMARLAAPVSCSRAPLHHDWRIPWLLEWSGCWETNSLSILPSVLCPGALFSHKNFTLLYFCISGVFLIPVILSRISSSCTCSKYLVGFLCLFVCLFFYFERIKQNKME